MYQESSQTFKYTKKKKSHLYKFLSHIQSYKQTHKHLIIHKGRRSIDGCSGRDDGGATSHTRDSRRKIPSGWQTGGLAGWQAAGRAGWRAYWRAGWRACGLASGRAGWLAGREREQEQPGIIEKEQEKKRESYIRKVLKHLDIRKKNINHLTINFFHIQTETQTSYNPQGGGVPSMDVLVGMVRVPRDTHVTVVERSLPGGRVGWQGGREKENDCV